MHDLEQQILILVKYVPTFCTLHLLGDLYTVECDNIHKKTVVKRSSKDHIFKMVIVMTVIYFSALLTQFLNYKPKKVH